MCISSPSIYFTKLSSFNWLRLAEADARSSAHEAYTMAQQEVDRLWEELQRVEQEIKDQEAKIDDAIENNKPEKVTNSYRERKERLVDKEKDLRHQLSALQIRLATPSGASSSQFVTHERFQRSQASTAEAAIAAAASAAADTVNAVLKQQELFGSYKTATIIGRTILEGVPQTMQKRLIASMAGGKLVEADSQLFYEVLLRRLHSLSNRDDLYVLPTLQSGIGHKKPDICISASPLKAAVSLAHAAELKSFLNNTTSRQEAASQCLERVRLILANQQHRSTCYALAGGADAMEVWRYTGPRPEACSNLLLLSWEADSPALQALVRLWSMTLEQIGYVPASMPIVQDNSAMLNNVMLLTTTSSREAELTPLPGTTVLQGE
ncbi:g2369 [Coccomyxa elongata]